MTYGIKAESWEAGVSGWTYDPAFMDYDAWAEGEAELSGWQDLKGIWQDGNGPYPGDLDQVENPYEAEDWRE